MSIELPVLDVILPRDQPWLERDGLAALRGNLAPAGAIALQRSSLCSNCCTLRSGVQGMQSCHPAQRRPGHAEPTSTNWRRSGGWGFFTKLAGSKRAPKCKVIANLQTTGNNQWCR